MKTVICGFPGIGKSSVSKERKDVLDLESSVFSWITTESNGKERRPDFPENYVQEIIKQLSLEKYKYILISSHQCVRDELNRRGIGYSLIIPAPNRKDEFLKNYKNRGNSIDFLAQLDENWVKYLEDCVNDKHSDIYMLSKGQYLATLLNAVDSGQELHYLQTKEDTMKEETFQELDELGIPEKNEFSEAFDKLEGAMRETNPEQLGLLGNTNTKYPQTPEEAIIETFDNPVISRPYNIRFNIPEFSSLCPKTGQPDYANMIIDYIPNKICVESKALKLFMFSFRNHGAFHETVTNEILERLNKELNPRWIRVTALFFRRGGISIDLWPEIYNMDDLSEEEREKIKHTIPVVPSVLEAAGRWQ